MSLAGIMFGSRYIAPIVGTAIAAVPAIVALTVDFSAVETPNAARMRKALIAASGLIFSGSLWVRRMPFIERAHPAARAITLFSGLALFIGLLATSDLDAQRMGLSGPTEYDLGLLR